MAEDTIKWNFEAENLSDYKLDFRMEANNKLFDRIYNKSRTRLMRKGKNIAGNPKLIEAFDIPPKYYNLIHTALKSRINIVIEEIKQDKIEILSSWVAAAKFMRNASDNWDIYIKVEGQYVDKR